MDTIVDFVRTIADFDYTIADFDFTIEDFDSAITDFDFDFDIADVTLAGLAVCDRCPGGK